MLGIKHKDIGQELTQVEWEADDAHELVSGTAFPETPTEKDLFYRTDEHKWYIYNGSEWKALGGVDISDADAAVGDVKASKTFYSVAAPKKTGTMPTVAIVAANDNYPAGYHVGNVGGLDAIDVDLIPINIVEGITIFGKAGTYLSYVIGDTTFMSLDAEVTNATVSWTKMREFQIGSHVKAENIRTYFQMHSETAGQEVRGRVYKNGGGFGTERSSTSTSYVGYTEDLSYTGGNLFGLYAKTVASPYPKCYIRYVRLKGTIFPTTLYGFKQTYP